MNVTATVFGLPSIAPFWILAGGIVAVLAIATLVTRLIAWRVGETRPMVSHFAHIARRYRSIRP